MRNFRSAAAAALFSILVCGAALGQSIDLTINSISDSPDQITLGQGDVTYTVTVYNTTGSSTATNLVLTNTLPTSSTYVSHTVSGVGTCTPSGGTVTCNWPSLNAFNTATATITVTPGAGGANTLTATISGSETDPSPANNTQTETTTVNATIDLQMNGITDSPTDITLGQGNVTYTINTYNGSTSKATNEVLTITLPASSTYVSSSSANYTCGHSAGVVTCTAATHNAFNGFSATVVVTPGADGTNTLTANISAEQGDPTPANNTESENTTVNATIDLQMNGITDSPTDITLGQGNVTYTINTYNGSTSKATNEVLTITLPASSTYVSSSSANYTCNESGGVVTCTVATHNAFNGFSATVVVTPGAGGTNTLTANVSAEQGDPTPANNTESENTTVNASIDLQMNGITDSPTDITLGQGNVTYTINTYNGSTSKATNEVLTITLPASSTYVSSSSANYTCGHSAGVVTCTAATHNAFNGFSATVIVTPGAGGTNTLTANVSAEQGDPTPGNNTESENTTVNATIDLQMNGISDSPADITLGQGNVTYTINTYNGSTSKATNEVLTITLPASSTFVSASSANYICGHSAGVVTCTLATHNAFNGFSATVVVTPGAGGTNTLTANVSAEQGDPTPANNTESENTTVNATIDLQMNGISDSPADITLGQGNVTYTINTYNGSTSKATNEVLTITLPASSTFVSSSSANYTCGHSAGVVTCTAATHNAFNGFSATVIVTPGAGGANTLSASVSAEQGDPTPANNTESETTTVNATIDLQMNGITDSPNDITLGQGNVTYTVNTYNGSSSKATNEVLTITLPASSTYVSSSSANYTCGHSAGVVTCTAATHNAFNGFSVTVIVTPGAGGTNTLTANVSALQGDPNTGNNSESETTTVNATIDLQLTVSDAPDPRVLAAGNVTYNATIHNANSSKATNPVFTLNLDPTTNFVSATPSSGGTCPLTGVTVQCTWPDVAAFSNRTVAVVVTPTSARQITATSSVAADQGDHNTANNSDTDTTNINPGSAPSIAGFSPASGPVATTVTITGSNFFSSTAVKFNGVSSTFTVANNGSITATVPAGATTGPIAITNSVGTTTSGSNFTVTPAPDLSITKTASAATTPTSSAFSYTLAVSNIGAGSAADVTVTDPLPAGVTLTGVSGTGWTCGGTTTVTCTMGALAASTSAPNITINVTAPASGTTVTNTATVSTTTPDASAGNNSSSVSVGVVGCPANPVVTYPAAVCENSTGHTASIAAVPSATYAWSVIAGDGTITSATNGTSITFDAGTVDPLTIKVEVFVPSCPTATTTFNVNVSTPTATITPSGATTFCTGGSVTLTANPGASYFWSNGATTQSVVISATETLTVNVTDATGCTATSAATTVTVNTPPAATITPSGPTTFCQGGQVTLNAPAGMTSYAWSNGATTPSIVVSNSGSFSVTITDTNGCSATSAATPVTVNPTPSATITPSGPTTFCAGGSVTLNAPAGMTNYSWSNGAATPSIVVNANGSFSVTVTDANGCSATSDPTSVTVNPAPPATISASGPTTFCAGGSVTLTANGGMSGYAWSNGATTSAITVSTAGSYTVTTTDGSGCSTTSAATVVTVNSAPAATITPSGPTSFCTGGSVVLTAPAGMANYLWSNGSTSDSITVTTSGSFTVDITDPSGCSATSAPTTVTVNPPPAATITASGPTTFCTGGSVTLSAPAGMTNYSWSNGANTQSIVVTASGTFSVTVTDASGCSAASAAVPVTVHPAPAAAIAGPSSTCANTSIVLDAGPSFASYSWSTGATTQQITVSPSVATTYTVTVTDGNSCPASASHNVTIDSEPVPVITPSGPTNFCAGGSVTLTASAATSYQWLVDNAPINGQTSSSLTVTTAGSYTVLATGAGGCSATSAATTVTVDPGPAAPAASNGGPYCDGGTIQLSASAIAGALYAWTGPNGFNSTAQNPSLPATMAASGVYSVTASVNGCTSASSSTTVVVKALPDATITAPSSVEANSPGNTASVPAQASATYAWTIANGVITSGATSNTVTFTAGNTGSVTLSVEVTIASCSGASSTSIPIVQPPPPLADVAVSKSAPSAVQTSGALAYTIVVTNNGFGNATAAITDTLPAGVALINVTSSLWSCTSSSSTITCSGGLGAGATTSIVLNTTAPQDAGTITNTVAITSSSLPDPDPSNNSASATTNVVATPPPCEAAPPSLLTPANDASLTSPVTFSWTAVNGASAYELWINTNGSLALAGTTANTTLTVSVASGASTWHVIAQLGGGCDPLVSAQRTFTVEEVTQPDPCAARTAATLIAPANNATLQTSRVELRWNAAAGATSYRLWASIDGAVAEVLGTTSETSLDVTIEHGEVIWWAEALYDGCASTESARFRFVIPERQNCSTPRPTTVFPSDDAVVTNANVAFLWNAVEGAIGYEVWLAAGNGAPILIGTTEANVTTLTRTVPAGELEWTVVVLVDRCPSRESQKARFTYAPPAACVDNERPILVSPLDGIDSTSPIDFEWNGPVTATRYELYVVRGANAPSLVATTQNESVQNVSLSNGALIWFVRAYFGESCSPLDSAEQELTVIPTPPACGDLDEPSISAPGEISSGVPFLIQWAPVAGATSYQLQLASNAEFDDAEDISTNGTSHELVRTNDGATPLAVYARVRAIDNRCTPPAIGSYGPISAVFILPAQGTLGTVPLGEDAIVTYTIVLGSELAGQTFTAVPTEPWLSVTPASGVVPPAGSTLIVQANTEDLGVGTNTGAISINLSGPTLSSNATSVSTPISVNLVTPVTPSPKNTPPPDAMIIPAVANAAGINAQFQSDVRVSNTSPQLIKYQLTFIPTGDAGISAGRQTTFSIEPGRTVALDDVLKSWFGTGTTNAVGSLEIRPLTKTQTSTSSAAVGALANIVSFASSRTFNVTPTGTFGQYIPAVPFANFLGKAANAASKNVLSLQQISQSDKFRTNLGLVEGSGEKAELLVKVFGSSGQQLTSFPVTLNGGQHTQLNAFLFNKGITLNDGRVEVEVVSGSGKITAYASVLDNATSDAVLVTPVTLSDTGNTKWVVPGVADIATGFANWKTDMRVFNAGTETADLIATFYSQNGGTPKTAQLSIPPGEVRQLDKVLPTLFNVTSDGGAVHLDSAKSARLIATARTYNETSTGSYGLFASAVTPQEAVGVGSRPLQLLQVEESSRYRSNIGFAEVTGKPVTLEVTVIPPDVKFAAIVEVPLAANEFRQIGALLSGLGLGTEVYNARISVRAVSGEGRATAYAAVIDMKTNDPTYVPAQ